MNANPVLVVGAGISGIACARQLRSAGIPVRVVDRGRRPGGRMATRALGGGTGGGAAGGPGDPARRGRPTDIGAAYFTVESGTDFAEVVDGWTRRGLARPWTDTLAVAGPEGLRDTTSGPMRHAAPGGLRSLVADLAHRSGIEIAQETTAESVDAEAPATVLAMPDPQARRLLADGGPALEIADRLDDAAGWEPVITVVLGWSGRRWPAEMHAAFVNDSEELALIADDGDRRGDGAGVLVAHTGSRLARAHLDEPDGAIASVTSAVTRLLGIAEAPEWSFAHRWTFARPAEQHPEPFLLEPLGEGLVAVCGDAWGPKSSVGGAFASGTALGRELVARLA